MENSLKTIILDFYGLPGSGKTTVSHTVSINLKKMGKRVFEASYKYDHENSRFVRRLKKLWTTVKFIINDYKRFKEIYVLTVSNGYITKSEAFTETVNVITKIVAIENACLNYNYIVFDEGIAQAAISLGINDLQMVSVNFDKIIDLLHFKPKIYLIKVPCNIDIALNRVLKRNTKDTRVELLNSYEEMILHMNAFEKAVNILDKTNTTYFIHHLRITI